MKIRKLSHDVGAKDGWHQCVIRGMEPREHYWHITPGIAGARARGALDASTRELERFPEVEESAPLGEIVIESDMEEYSGWTENEHCDWLADSADIDARQLRALVFGGGCIVTNEAGDVAHALVRNHCDAVPRRII